MKAEKFKQAKIKIRDTVNKLTGQDKLIEQYINYLSIGIANLINIFEPEAIGIGGSFVFYEEIFLEKLKRKILEDKLLFNERKELLIQTAILDNDAGLIGSTL